MSLNLLYRVFTKVLFLFLKIYYKITKTVFCRLLLNTGSVCVLQSTSAWEPLVALITSTQQSSSSHVRVNILFAELQISLINLLWLFPVSSKDVQKTWHLTWYHRSTGPGVWAHTRYLPHEWYGFNVTSDVRKNAVSEKRIVDLHKGQVLLQIWQNRWI